MIRLSSKSLICCNLWISVKLPELLAHVNIEEETLTRLQQKLLDFLKYRFIPFVFSTVVSASFQMLHCFEICSRSIIITWLFFLQLMRICLLRSVFCIMLQNAGSYRRTKAPSSSPHTKGPKLRKGKERGKMSELRRSIHCSVPYHFQLIRGCHRLTTLIPWNSLPIKSRKNSIACAAVTLALTSPFFLL